MKATKLYNLIKAYEIHDNGLIFIDYYQAEDFFKQIKDFICYGDNGIEAHLREGYLCFSIKDVCEDCGLEWEYVKENLIK